MTTKSLPRILKDLLQGDDQQNKTEKNKEC